MAKVKVLIEGYAKEIKGGWLASSTTALVRSDKIKILVDPGTNRKLLLKRLAEEKLKITDIHFVFMTHCHPDHNLLTGIFSGAKVLDDGLIYEGDKQTEHQKVIPGTEIKIVPTPGHDEFHSSLVVPTEKGTVVVAGDVFWWSDNEREDTSSVEVLLDHNDPFVKDEKVLLESRKKVLEIADWIIPGHGKMFHNPKRR
jgi:glyoxylase-like metal-dependent hydrolase (beta-lactamase superfamily II)